MAHSAPLRLVTEPLAPSPRDAWGRAASGPTHAVQFYERDEFLADTVADFLAPGLSGRHPCLVIATEEHRNAFTDRLIARDVNVSMHLADGVLTLLDARETLGAFMDGDYPVRQRFFEVIGRALEASSRAGRHGLVRAFGEMVALLWLEGKPEAALRVEALWNEIASRHSFSLLCAYPMSAFSTAADSTYFADVCHEHAHVLPTERYAGDQVSRLSEITRLQQKAQALETEIESRRELEQQLRAALKVAEEANKTKSEFLAVMSHELRTPLNAIAGHLSLIEMGIHGPTTAGQQDALDRIRRSQQHLLTLINDLMNLARVEAGKLSYRLEHVPVQPLLSDTAATLEAIFSAKRITCTVGQVTSAAGSEIVARADRERVEQILLNLLMNALKYTAPGGTVYVDAVAHSGQPSQVAINVRDSGIGIAPDKLETIFEPFVQLGVRSSQEGVGLGLAISRDLARGMGGELIATSAIGQGSTFTLLLPRA